MISALGKAIVPSAGADPVGVVGMQMRHEDDIDAGGIDAGGGEIAQRAADRTLARLEGGAAEAAVDQHQLAAGIDELRVERHRHHALGHVGGRRSGERLGLRHVAHEGVGQRERAGAVVDRGAFEAADLVTIKTGRLRAGRRRGGLSSRRCERGQRGGGAGRGGANQKMAAV